LDPVFGLWLARRLKAKNLDHDLAEPYPMDKMFDVALYILKSTPTVLDKGDLRGATATRDRWGWSSTPEPLVKREPVDFKQWGEKLIFTMSQAMETGMANIMQRMQLQLGRYQPTVPAVVPAVPVPSVNPSSMPNAYLAPMLQSCLCPRPGVVGSRCFMCHDSSHFLGDCKTVDQHIVAGKLKRDGGNLVMGNGDQIPNDPRGAPWSQRIDEYYTRMPQPTPPPPHFEREQPLHMSANYFSIKTADDEAGDIQNTEVYLEALSELAEEAEDPVAIERVLKVLQNCIIERKKRQNKVRTAEVPTVAVTPLDNTMAYDRPREPTTPMPTLNKLPYSNTLRCPKATGQPQNDQEGMLQFKYSSPLEAGSSPDPFIQRILAQQVLLSVGKAIALCPEVRKFFKEGMTMRQIQREKIQRSLIWSRLSIPLLMRGRRLMKACTAYLSTPWMYH
jgi:hypothetical protein